MIMVRQRDRRHGRRSRGQSTLEYILVIAAVLLAIIAAIGRVLTPRVDQVQNQAGNALSTASNRFGTRIQMGN